MGRSTKGSNAANGKKVAFGIWRLRMWEQTRWGYEAEEKLKIKTEKLNTVSQAALFKDTRSVHLGRGQGNCILNKHQLPAKVFKLS